MQPENKKSLRYNHQAFREEAVEAYTTRQAGEPWDLRLRFETFAIIVLTVLAAAALVLVLWGGR